MCDGEIGCKCEGLRYKSADKFTRCGIGSAMIPMGIDMVPVNAGIAIGASIGAKRRDDPLVLGDANVHLPVRPATFSALPRPLPTPPYFDATLKQTDRCRAAAAGRM